MRCPYCGGYNPDRATFCARCGRDIAMTPPAPPSQRQQPPQPAPRPPYPPSQRPAYPPQTTTPAQPPLPRQPAPMPSAVPGGQPGPRGRRQSASTTIPAPPPVPVAPEPPAPFPPRTLADLKSLEQGALDYTVIDETASYGRKKIVKLLFQRCTPWQQVATLLKALKAYQSPDYDRIILFGLYSQDASLYEFTNGKLEFDQNARLGSQIIRRYQIETSNGLDSDAVRFVLTDKSEDG